MCGLGVWPCSVPVPSTMTSVPPQTLSHHRHCPTTGSVPPRALCHHGLCPNIHSVFKGSCKALTVPLIMPSWTCMTGVAKHPPKRPTWPGAPWGEDRQVSPPAHVVPASPCGHRGPPQGSVHLASHLVRGCMESVLDKAGWLQGVPPAALAPHWPQVLSSGSASPPLPARSQKEVCMWGLCS